MENAGNPNDKISKSKKTEYLLKLGLIIVALAGYAIITHSGSFFSAISTVVSVLWPFILGAVIAFFFIVPMRFIERLITPKDKMDEAPRRGLAYILTLVAFILVISLIMLIIIPQISDAISQIIAKAPAAFNRINLFLNDTTAKYPVINDWIDQLDISSSNIQKHAMALLNKYGTQALNGGVGLVSGVIGSVANAVIAFIFSIYLVLQKEKLSSQAKQVTYSIFKEETAEKIISVARLSNRIFSNFISGQCIEACILGTMFFVELTIFQIHYPLLIGVIIAVTALIPIFGAFIGLFIGVFLLIINSPMEALYFIIIFFVTQQIENNLIYPRVVGGSIGLPALWVLFAVSAGGSLFGVAGIIIFIPFCSVCYALYRTHVKEKLKKKEVENEKFKPLYGDDAVIIIDELEDRMYGSDNMEKRAEKTEKEMNSNKNNNQTNTVKKNSNKKKK